MEIKKPLKTIFIISFMGVLFSGYLSYSELISKTCNLGSCTSLLGMPVCIYGFVMYFLILIISWFGIKSGK